MSVSIGPDDKKKIIGILSVLFPQAKLYVFGSRVKNQSSKFSDLDIAIDIGKKIDLFDISEAKDMFANSNIPFNLDIVDYNNIPSYLRESIDKEKVVWKE